MSDPFSREELDRLSQEAMVAQLRRTPWYRALVLAAVQRMLGRPLTDEERDDALDRLDGRQGHPAPAAPPVASGASALTPAQERDVRRLLGEAFER